MKTKFLGTILITAVLATFAGCDDGDPAHTHDFSGAWQKDATHHWKVCAADGAEGQKAVHTPANGVCTTCQYDNTPPYVPSNHLGIGETCPNSTACTIKSYGTAAGQQIQRFGALAAGFDDVEITKVAKAIEEAYKIIEDKGTTEDQARVAVNEAIQIINSASAHTYNETQKLLQITMAGNVPAWLKGHAHPKSNHLGVGESGYLCDGRTDEEACGLKDYNKREEKILDLGDATILYVLDKPIYRYGAESNYPDNELPETADKIINAFGQIIINAGGDMGIHDNILKKIGKLYVVKAANGRYTWNKADFDTHGKTDFGVDSSDLPTAGFIAGRLNLIPGGTLGNADIAGGIKGTRPGGA